MGSDTVVKGKPREWDIGVERLAGSNDPVCLAYRLRERAVLKMVMTCNRMPKMPRQIPPITIHGPATLPPAAVTAPPAKAMNAPIVASRNPCNPEDSRFVSKPNSFTTNISIETIGSNLAFH